MYGAEKGGRDCGLHMRGDTNAFNCYLGGNEETNRV